jgi:hypothetical protein
LVLEGQIPDLVIVDQLGTRPWRTRYPTVANHAPEKLTFEPWVR